MLFEFDNASAVRDDDRHAVVVDLFLDNLDVLLVILGQRDDIADMLRFDTETFADATNLVVCRRRLTTRHGGDVVVENHDHNVGLLIDAVHKTRQAAVTEGTVTDDSHAREDAHLAGTLGHGDGGTHAHGGVDGTHVEA